MSIFGPARIPDGWLCCSACDRAYARDYCGTDPKGRPTCPRCAGPLEAVQ